MSVFKKRKKLWIFLSVVVIFIVGGAVYARNQRNKPTDVLADLVKKQRLVAKVTASGKIQPKKKVDISASIPGKITKLAVEEGDRVQKGDFLLQIDSAPYEANLANARAALSRSQSFLDSAKVQTKQSELTWQRKAKMWDDKAGLISQDEYERAKMDFDMQKEAVKGAEHQVEQAEADLDRARDDLSKTRVSAPMGGIVVRRVVEEGEVAVIGTMNNPGTILLTIADLSVMESELEVDETDVGLLQIGQKATITVDAFPGKKFEGQVTEIGNSPIVKGSGSQESTDFKVTITLDTPDSNLRPGLTADGEITTAVRDNCTTVPIQALVVRDFSKEADKSKLTKEEREKEGVFVVQNGKAIFRAVKTGVMGEMDIEIKDGLKPGEQIVTGTYQTLRDLKNEEPIAIKKPEEMTKETKDTK